MELGWAGRRNSCLLSREDLPDDPDRVRIGIDRLKTVIEVAFRELVVVVHCADVSPCALARCMIPVRVEPTTWPTDIPAVEGLREIEDGPSLRLSRIV
jgi:hypothetical protein